MFNSLIHGHAPLRILLFLAISQLISARVSINSLPQQSFLNTFESYPPTGPGGCDRTASNGVDMMQHTLKSLGGTWAIAKTVAQDLPNYSSETYIRGLLFLFFGITFQTNKQLNPDPRNVDAYNNVIRVFDLVNKVFTDPATNAYNLKPRFRCLEDYASYYTRLAGADGKEDESSPLAGQVYYENSAGSVRRPPPYNDPWPGMMFVWDELQATGAWYLPQPGAPSLGRCGGPARTEAFANAGYNTSKPSEAAAAKVLYGLTMCQTHFDKSVLLDLGTPARNSGWPELHKFIDSTADLTHLHELMHVVSRGAIKDQPAVLPPSDDAWFTSRNWALWTLSPTIKSYGFQRTILLGLARPALAGLNADNWTKFAGCMYFTELNCVGMFTSQYRTIPHQSRGVGLKRRFLKRAGSGGWGEMGEGEGEENGKESI